MNRDHDDIWLDPESPSQEILDEMKKLCDHCRGGAEPGWWVEKPHAKNKAVVWVSHGPTETETTCGGQDILEAWYRKERGW